MGYTSDLVATDDDVSFQSASIEEFFLKVASFADFEHFEPNEESMSYLDELIEEAERLAEIWSV